MTDKPVGDCDEWGVWRRAFFREIVGKARAAAEKDSEGRSPSVEALADNSMPLKERVGNFERAIIVAALAKTDWNQKKAARLLGVNATTLSEKLKRLKIKSR